MRWLDWAVEGEAEELELERDEERQGELLGRRMAVLTFGRPRLRPSAYRWPI